MSIDIKRTPVSYGGVALTNADRKARFLLSDSGIQNAPLYNVVSAARIGDYPAFVRMQPPEGKAFPVSIELLTFTEEQVRLLRDMFDPSSGGLTQLIIEDGSTVQRFVNCLPLGLQEDTAPFVWVAPLWAPEPILYKAGSVESVSQANITNAGHVFAPSNTGDLETHLTLIITPTAKKNIRDSWIYLRRCILLNNSEAPLTDPVSKGGLGRGYPVDIANAGFDTATLIRATPQLATIVDGGDGITNSQLTIGVSDPGNFNPNGGIAWIGAAGSGEQFKYNSVSGSNVVLPTGGRGWGGTTAQGFGEGTSIFNSKMVADGRDIAVFVDRAQVPAERVSISGINTANTKVFVPLEVPEKRTFLLDAAIDDSVTKFVVRDGIEKLPPAPFRIRIGTEVMRCGVRDLATRQLTVTRPIENTTAATHAAGDTITWVPLHIQVAYGWAEAPARPANPDPIVFALSLSTNGVWEITGQPWSNTQGPGGFVRKRTGKNRFADRVSLSGSGGQGIFLDSAPSASVPAYDTLEFYAPCGIDDAAGAIEFDSIIQGGAMVLELELIDLAGNKAIVARYHGHTAGVAQHDLSHQYTGETFQPPAVVRTVRFRGRQSVVTGSITDDVDESMEGAAVTNVDLQTFAIDNNTPVFGFMARMKESAAGCDKAANLEVYQGDPADLTSLKLSLLAAGWSVPNADISTAYKNFCYFPYWTTKGAVLEGGKQFSMKLFEFGGTTEGLVLARNAQSNYPRGSHWRFNSVGPVWEEQVAEDIWFLVLGEFDDDADEPVDNQPEAPFNTGHLVTVDNAKLTLDASRTPTIDLRPEEDAYYIDSTLSRSGQTLDIAHLQQYTGSRTLTIAAKTGLVTDGEYGDENAAAIVASDKAKRFTQPPGAGNVTYLPAGVAELRETAALQWRSAWQA